MLEVFVNIKDGESITDRATYKRIKQMDRKDLDCWLINLYKEAFSSGAKAAEEALTKDDSQDGDCRVEWDLIIDTIKGVDGVGDALAQKIEEAVLAAVWGEKNDKKGR